MLINIVMILCNRLSNLERKSAYIILQVVNHLEKQKQISFSAMYRDILERQFWFWIGEAGAVAKGPAYAKEFLDRVKEKTGIKPMLYSYNNCINAYDWSAVKNADYGLWNAGYYNGYTEMGYTPKAPLKGGLGAWGSCAMYQYTSSGKLTGWPGHLDLDVFYGDAAAWDKYAGGSAGAGTSIAKPAPAPIPAVNPTNQSMKNAQIHINNLRRRNPRRWKERSEDT